jgi:hypothetical protein
MAGTLIIRAHRLAVRCGKAATRPFAFYAVVPGTAIRRMSAPRTATGTCLLFATSSLASVLPERSCLLGPNLLCAMSERSFRAAAKLIPPATCRIFF